MNRLVKIYLVLLGTWCVLKITDISFLSSLRFFTFWSVFILTVFFLFRFTRQFIRRLLWRIRRKLILSYIFIGFIPVSLLFVLFFLGFFIFMGQATSEMFNSALDSYVLQTKIESEKLVHLAEFTDPHTAIDRWYQELQPEDRKWLGTAEITIWNEGTQQVLKGKEAMSAPAWLHKKDFAALVLRDSTPWLAVIHQDQEKQRGMLMLVPLGQELLGLIKKKTDADIHYVPFSTDNNAQNELQQTLATTKNQPIWPVWWDFPVWWFSLPNQYDWQTGKKIVVLEVNGKEPDQQGLLILDDKGKGNKEINSGGKRIGAFWVSTNVSRVYNHIFARSTSLQKFIYAMMVAIAIFFLIIELISFLSGFLLARSITASVHNLFEGTERIKSGDLNYRIKVGAQDQLGELAMSFNNMTDSIKTLLAERTEKERLAESLRIARQLQQRLLPREITSIGGVQISTMNLPAEEVCGDYYDIIRNNENQMGIIIADVSGKGPSAALYMAEVKGVILSLSRQTVMPRDVLLEANRILAPTLDPRSFITVCYAMINERDKIMKLSRAGHNPVLHYSAQSATIEVVQPRGIGLGLGRDGIFEQSLEEIERKLCSGDVLVFYTDGLTEAMNAENQLYGLPRLSDILQQHIQDSAEDIKNAILNDLQSFLNRGLPQDDITLVLLKMQ
jgi:serine phosphatase RsbU (regulator of sigma subunit)